MAEIATERGPRCKIGIERTASGKIVRSVSITDGITEQEAMRVVDVSIKAFRRLEAELAEREYYDRGGVQ